MNELFVIPSHWLLLTQSLCTTAVNLLNADCSISLFMFLGWLIPSLLLIVKCYECRVTETYGEVKRQSSKRLNICVRERGERKCKELIALRAQNRESKRRLLHKTTKKSGKAKQRKEPKRVQEYHVEKVSKRADILIISVCCSTPACVCALRTCTM
jgi:hypothetical protein